MQVDKYPKKHDWLPPMFGHVCCHVQYFWVCCDHASFLAVTLSCTMLDILAVTLSCLKFVFPCFVVLTRFWIGMLSYAISIIILQHERLATTWLCLWKSHVNSMISVIIPWHFFQTHANKVLVSFCFRLRQSHPNHWISLHADVEIHFLNFPCEAATNNNQMCVSSTPVCLTHEWLHFPPTHACGKSSRIQFCIGHLDY